MDQKFVGILSVIVASLLFGIHVAINKVGLNEGLHPLSFTLFRAYLAILILLPFVILNRHDGGKIKRRLGPLATLGLVGYGVGPLALFYGLNATTAVNSGFLLQTEPLFITLYGLILLKERVGLRGLAGILALVAGAYLFTTSGSLLIFNPGDLLILITAASWALEAVIYKSRLRELNLFASVFMGYVFGSLLIFASYLALSPPVPSGGWGWILASSVTIAFTMVLYYNAIRLIGAIYATALIYILSALFAAGIAVLSLGESIGPVQGVGAVLILAGAAWLSREAGSRNQQALF